MAYPRSSLHAITLTIFVIVAAAQLQSRKTCTEPEAPVIKDAIWSRTWLPKHAEIFSLEAQAVIVFSGHNDYASIMADSARKARNVMRSGDGRLYFFSYGGGNHHGIINDEALRDVRANVRRIKEAGYSGVSLDIEECHGSLNVRDLENTLKVIKSSGLLSLVTVSHSAPYGCANKAKIMDTLLKSCNVDYLSPQLYTTGSESSVDMQPTAGYGWRNYAKMQPRTHMLPSINYFSHFQGAKDGLRSHGVTDIRGYICWNEDCKTHGMNTTRATPAAATPIQPAQGNNTASGEKPYYCAKTYAANGVNCGLRCHNDGDCPSGLSCFIEVRCCHNHEDSGNGIGRNGLSCSANNQTQNLIKNGDILQDLRQDGDEENRSAVVREEGKAEETVSEDDQINITPVKERLDGVTAERGHNGPYFCSQYWYSRNVDCSLGCYSDADCPTGLKCWAGVSCCANHLQSTC